MAPPPLPQELIDKIVDQFSGTARSVENRDSNKRTLASLSLFSVIHFQISSSMDLTETDLNELGPVFSLARALNIDECWEIFSHSDPVTIAFLRRFCNLESLFLTNWYSRWLSTEQLSTCFRHFGKTVADLRLEGKASSESLIYLTSIFPLLRVL